jgi:nucleoside-diphosphate-sugar epimerase
MIYIVAGIAELAGKITRSTPTLNLEKAKEMTQKGWACSSAKATRDFGWKEEYPLEIGSKLTAEWAKKEGWL